MNYIKEFMQDNRIETGQLFKIERFPRLKFFFDDLCYLCVEEDDYTQIITDTEHILFTLLRGDHVVSPIEHNI